MVTSSRWFRASMVLIAIAALASVVPPNVAQAGKPVAPSYQYTIKLLPPYRDGVYVTFNGINASGEVVGSETTSDPNYPHGVLYTPGIGWCDLNTVFDNPTTIISPPDAIPQDAFACVGPACGINDAGQIVGFLYVRGSDGKRCSRAFRYTQGSTDEPPTWPPTFEVLVDGAFNHSSGRAINHLGEVAGNISNDITGTHDGFLWRSDGTHVVFPGLQFNFCINDFGQIGGGNIEANNLGFGYRYTPAYIDLDGNSHSSDISTFAPFGAYPLGGGYSSRCSVLGIDNDGDVVGQSTTTNILANRAFKCLNGQQMVNLGTLDGSDLDSGAKAITGPTGAKTIVGWSQVKVGGRYPYYLFVYTDKMRDLYKLIDPATIPVGMKPGDLSDFNIGVNALGEIAGTAQGDTTKGASGLYAGRIFVITPK